MVTFSQASHFLLRQLSRAWPWLTFKKMWRGNRKYGSVCLEREGKTGRERKVGGVEMKEKDEIKKGGNGGRENEKEWYKWRVRREEGDGWERKIEEYKKGEKRNWVSGRDMACTRARETQDLFPYGHAGEPHDLRSWSIHLMVIERVPAVNLSSNVVQTLYEVTVSLTRFTIISSIMFRKKKKWKKLDRLWVVRYICWNKITQLRTCW